MRHDITEAYCKKWTEMSTRGLARKLYNENNLNFPSYDACRNSIKYYRGQMGDTKRKSIGNNLVSYKPVMPVSFADDFTPFEISQSKILILSDIHIPFQDNEAVELAIKYGIENGANCVLLNGDTIDFAGISRHENNWKNRKVSEEFELCRQFLEYLRHKFPKARIVWKDGNHDERWEKYLFNKAPEIFDDKEFRLPIRLKFGEYRIEHVTDKRPIKIGKLNVLHGHELAGGSGGVNPARATFLKTLESVLVGHYHKTSSHTESTLLESVISVESQGCLCGLHPNYMPINKWNLGFSFVELNVKTGKYKLHNKRIIKGEVY